MSWHRHRVKYSWVVREMPRKRRTVRRKETVQQILRMIYNEGPVSRSELADRLRLAVPSVMSALGPLIDSGLLSSSHVSLPVLGRSRQLVDLIPSAYYTIGVDAGPYATYCSLSDLRGRQLISQDFPVCPKDYPTAVGFIADAISTLLERSGADPDRVAGVGIGTPGFVDSSNGFVRHSTMHDWGNVWLADDVKAITGFPCVVENNALCRSLSASMFEEKNLPDIFAYFYVAKGICCPVSIRGRGAPEQLPGELGHMIMEKDGPDCPTCGHKGCLEAVASERAVEGQCKALRASGQVTALPATGDIGIAEVLEAARDGDRSVQAVLDTAMCYLGLALSNMVNLAGPELVLVDGYMFQEEQNKQTMLKAAKENLFAIDITDVDIRFLVFDEWRTAWGAAAKAVERFVIEEEPV